MILSLGASACQIKIWFLTAMVLALAIRSFLGWFLSYSSIHLWLSFIFGWAVSASSPSSQSSSVIFFLRRLLPVFSASFFSAERMSDRLSGANCHSLVLQAAQLGQAFKVPELRSQQQVRPH